MTAELEPRSVRHLRPRERLVARPVPVGPATIDEGEAGLVASAPNLRMLFEEAAAELVRVRPHPEGTGPACRWENVALRAPDLSTLAGLWLDRLITLGDSRFSDLRREAIVNVAVDRVSPPEDDPQYGRWQLRARVGLRPYQETGVPAPAIRSASDRPLAVERNETTWTLRARLAFGT